MIEKICEFCGNHYIWDNTPNYGKRGRIIKSDRFCCYECGVKYITNKIKGTFIKKYGVDNISKLPEIKEKKKHTFYNNFGTDYGKCEAINKQREETCLNKYGVKSPLESKLIRDKANKTIKEKYGVDNIFQSKEIIEKIKQTNLKRYGVTSNMKDPVLYKKNLDARLANGCLYSSKMEKDWLDFLGITSRQKYILGYLVDGYDETNNIIYEFLGDKWHCNPHSKYNKGKKFTEQDKLFIKTFDRFKKFKENGYRIIYCWETDWLDKLNLTREFFDKLEY